MFGDRPPNPLTRADLEAWQLQRLGSLLQVVAEGNRFYRPRLERGGLLEGVRSLDEFRRLPFTTKDELVADQARHPPYGSNLTFEPQRYARLHATSGTSGQPLRWLDTPESWRWMLGNWARVYQACGVGPEDRIFFPFSFGPFLGFWTAFEAAWQLGCLTLPGGGMTSKARVRVLVENQANVLCATPTYALRLAQTAQEEGLSPADLPVRKIIVAGEPGGSVAAVRDRLSRAWSTSQNPVIVYDHHGMTEVGPVSYPSPQVPGILHVIGTSYLAEVVDPETDQPVAPGERGELILTTLGREGMPLLRYRTGDLVCWSRRSAADLGTADPALEGGILARVDDMVVIRGVNLYPSAVDAVVRGFAEVAEYRVDLWSERGMREARVVVEPLSGAGSDDTLADQIADALRTGFQLRLPVSLVGPGDLPRFDLKAKRWRVLEEPPSQ
ncbi:MAG: AMP-binding protein [Thermoanaerobaculia bacterium]|nr:AMP-binding protein [Thermoanaerobaculia bacterium]